MEVPEYYSIGIRDENIGVIKIEKGKSEIYAGNKSKIFEMIKEGNYHLIKSSKKEADNLMHELFHESLIGEWDNPKFKKILQTWNS